MANRDARDLTRAEESYAAQVKYQLRHLPQQQQLTLMQSVRRTLLTAQPTDGYPRLEKEMGPPAQFAERLLGRGGGHREPVATPEKKRGFFSRGR